LYLVSPNKRDQPFGSPLILAVLVAKVIDQDLLFQQNSDDERHHHRNQKHAENLHGAKDKRHTEADHREPCVTRMANISVQPSLHDPMILRNLQLMAEELSERFDREIPND
jgi:hypothetical protein